jgi:hypothetical protein
MSLLDDIAQITQEIKNLEMVLTGSTDTHIREVIEFRIEECKIRLAELRAEHDRK